MDKNRSIDVTKIAYQLPQPAGMISDIFVAAALDLEANEREWVPRSADGSFRPLILMWHLGFWEWIGSGPVFLFLLSSALLLPQAEHGPPGK